MEVKEGRKVLAVVGKRPLKGFSKTRLAEDIGEEWAIRFYEAFMKDFFERFHNLSTKIPLYFFYTPDDLETHDYFANFFKENSLSPKLILPQKNVSFFQRLSLLFKDIFWREGECMVHLTGTDVPHFPFEQLNENEDRAIGPDIDGGFYYARFMSIDAEVFDIYPLNSDKVFEELKMSVQSQNLTCKILPVGSDIDTYEDLEKVLKEHKSKLPHTFKLYQSYKTLNLGSESDQ